MKKILLSILAVLAIFSFMGFASFAGVAGPVNTPAWINCIGQFASVQSTSKAYAGTSNVLVAWVAHQYDSQGLFGVCFQVSFNEIEFSVQVYHAGFITAHGPTFASTSTYPPSGITVSVIASRTICITKYSCHTVNYPYILQYGDGVCVNEMVFYGAVNYNGGYCYYV